MRSVGLALCASLPCDGGPGELSWFAVPPSPFPAVDEFNEMGENERGVITQPDVFHVHAPAAGP